MEEEIDIARFGLGVDEHPERVAGLGGKYFFEDDQEFSDTQVCVFEWPIATGTGRCRGACDGHGRGCYRGRFIQPTSFPVPP
jgi:hypothetical protein